MARALHGHNVCAEISPKPLSGLNFQIEDSEKFGLEQVTNWQLAGDVLTLRGARNLRFRLSTN
jgi:hypothetical protein